MLNLRSNAFVFLVIALLLTAAGAAQDEFEFTTEIDFKTSGKTTLEGKAGDVEVTGVEFATGFAKGGMFGTSDPELVSVITAKLNCATTASTKRKFDITLEFLDADGELIDRTSNDASIKGESKVVKFDHTTLKWAVSHIEKVRITVQAKGK